MKPCVLSGVALASALTLIAPPALALYKIVGPDGSVTYTDRPPTASKSQVSTLQGGTISEVAPPDPLPVELKQTTARFPVVLYTAADCAPCDAGRQLLVQRGIPFTEKLIVSEDDAVTLERSFGLRTVPALTIGSQALRGLSADEWNAYLDAARYPRESRLPQGWQYQAPEPLVLRTTARSASAPVVERPARAPRTPPAELPSAPPSGLRF